MNREELERLLQEVQANHKKIKASEIVPADILEQKMDRSPDITLHFLLAQEKITLDVSQSQTIGRSHAKNPEYDGLDLASFDALEHGVSRKHATVSLEQGNFILRDLGSLNGTFLNGVRLSPKYDYILRHGDIVTLGRLDIRVTFSY